jgi:acyl carrier protein
MNSGKNTREILSKLWLEVLDGSGKDQVEDNEKFFECGGNSIAAIRLYIETEEQLTVEVDSAEFLGTLAEGDFDALVRLMDAAAADSLNALHR